MSFVHEGNFFTQGQSIVKVPFDKLTTATFLRDYVATATPVLIRGGVKVVSALWTHDHLRKVVQPGLEVDVDVGCSKTRGLFADTKDQRSKLNLTEITIPFEHLLDTKTHLKKDHDYYLQQQSWPFDTIFTQLSLEHRTLSCDVITSMASSAHAKIMWLGTAPTVSQLHFDRKDNLISQMCGVKRVILLPHTESGCLSPYTDTTGTHFEDRFSAIDLNLSHEEATVLFPLASSAVASIIDIEPGDVLFLPKMWWHIVVSTPDTLRNANIMVNMFFDAHHISD
eukprot:m.125859 g.125859  ORF g.125859 m.125859 type:complete len:282 (-) comp29159_c0_seq6:69-914(-)